MSTWRRAAYLLIAILALHAAAASAQETGESPAALAPVRPLQIDVVGQGQFSRFNFTNLITPYDGVDAYTILRVGHWWERGRRIGLFGEAVPVFASPREFFFQRHVQFNGGLQLYPVGGGNDALRLLRPLRVFVQVSRRSYYDAVPGSMLKSTNLQVGLDYYYDNLFAPQRWKAFAFTTVGLHSTAFGVDEYDAVAWSGNVKTGPSFVRHQDSTFVPYAVIDWTYAPEHPDRFWENFLRVGGGVRWYPQKQQTGTVALDLRGRLHLFGEVVGNAAWLGHTPNGQIET